MKFPQSLLTRTARSESDLAAEQLEPRVLFSAAPVDADAPTETDSADAPAQETPAVAEAVQPPGASTPSPVEAPQPQEPAEPVPAEPDAGDVSVEQKVVLVNVDANAKQLNQQATGGAPSDAPETSLLLLSTDTTSVEVDSNGNLVIEDILGDNTDDKLFIGLVDGRLEVRDSRNTVGSSIVNATAVGNRGRGVSIELTSFTGDIIVRAQRGDDTITIGDLDGLPGGIIIEEGAGQDVIKQKGIVNLSNDAQVNYTAEQIRLEQHSSLATEDGKIALVGNINETSSKRSVGVWANGSRISSDSGEIEIIGVGGIKGSANRGVYLRGTEITSSGIIGISGSGGGTGSSNDGIYLARGTSISASGDANLTLDGTGGTGKSGNRGVYIQSGVDLQTADGQLSVTGVGSPGTSSNSGVVIGKATLQTGGAGRIQIGGYSHGEKSNNVGTQLRGTTITAAGSGLVMMQGFSDRAYQGSRNYGMDLHSATVTAQDGDVIFQATAGRGQHSNIALRATGTAIESENSKVTLFGVGANTATGNNNRGIDMSRSVVSSGSELQMIGTGGSGVNSNSGMRINATQITAGANLRMTGTASAATTGTSNRGIELRNSDLSGLVVLLTGDGGTGTHRNVGLHATKGSIVARTAAAILTGEALADTTGSHNRGVELLSTRIQAGAGAVITGTGGGGNSHNQGVRIVRGSLEATPLTGVQINGEARNTTTGSSNIGVYFKNGITVKGKNLMMTGTGGGGVGLNHGLLVDRNITADVVISSFDGTAGTGLTSEDKVGDFFE